MGTHGQVTSLLSRAQGLAAWPQVRFVAAPTRVRRLEEARRRTQAHVWVKCDNETSHIYGGNKARKLEFLLTQALSQRARGLWLYGPRGSHHVLAAARFAARLGLSCRAFLFPQCPSPHAEEVARAIRQGTCEVFEATSWSAFLSLCLRHPPRPDDYVLPPGSSNGLGCLGYVVAGLEIAEQVRTGILPAPDRVVLALGSCGTAAGLLVGLAAAGLETDLDLVRVTSPAVANVYNVHRLVWDTLWTWRRIAPGDRIPGGPPYRGLNLRIVADQYGGTYGLATPAARWAVEAARTDDLDLETTYTGKAFAHLLQSARPGETVLFLNTYAGSAALTSGQPPGGGRDPLPRRPARRAS